MKKKNTYDIYKIKLFYLYFRCAYNIIIYSTVSYLYSYLCML